MPDAPLIDVTIDGRTATVAESATIFDAAKQLGIEIPALCHRPDLGLAPVAVCRACLVDTGEKNFAAACIRQCGTLKDERSGKVKPVTTTSPDLEAARKTLVELLLVDHPRPCARHRDTLDCELELLGERYGLLEPLRRDNGAAARYHTPDEPPAGPALADDYGQLTTPFLARKPRELDTSNFAIAVDHSACITCDRCVRACNDVAGFDIIGRNGKGPGTYIGFDADADMGKSGCVNCGHCMVACPTGALQFTGIHRGQTAGRKAAGLSGALTLEEMRDLPFVKDAKVPPNFLKRLEGGIRVRQFAKGEVLCRQGERGHTAYYIDSGSVDVYLEPAVAPAAGGLLARVGQWFGKAEPAGNGTVNGTVNGTGNGTGNGKVNGKPDSTWIARVPEVNSPASHLLGEASCRNGQPRNATVRAHEDTIALEMERDVLEVLLRSPAFRADFDRVNRHRLIQNFLRGLPLFDCVTAAELDALEPQTELVSCQPGQVVFRRGDAADSLFLVRLGHVKVEQDGEVINYLTPGQYFGELAVLQGTPRSATCTAMNHADLLRIPKATLDRFVANHPDVAGFLSHTADRRRVRDQFRPDNCDAPPRTLALQQYVDQQLYEGQSLLLIDLDRCTRCDECVRACAQSHGGVGRLIRDGQRFDKYLVPTACRSCHDPKCLGGCPVDAIHRTAEGGLAIVVEDHCVGCGFCFGQDMDGNLTGTGCPYGNISPVPVTRVDPKTHEKRPGRIATVCDLDGCTPEGVEPSCVYACPHEAAVRVNAHDFFGKPLLRAAGADV